MLDTTNPAAHIETRACLVCGAGFDVDLDHRGRRAVYCGPSCRHRATRLRQSAAKQDSRRESAGPCVTCGGAIAVKIRGPVPTFCSSFCREVANGNRRESLLPPITCALPSCSEVFVPDSERQKCCSERHGKTLYNRLSRADGRQEVKQEWSDARRDAYHRRRALKKRATTGAPVRRDEIAARDGYLCGLCGDRVSMDLEWPHSLSPSLDHVVPLTKGGAHDPSNVQLAHLRCNTAKGNRVA